MIEVLKEDEYTKLTFDEPNSEMFLWKDKRGVDID